MSTVHTVIAGVLTILVAACGDPSSPSVCSVTDGRGCTSVSFSPEVGFVELGERQYSIGDVALSASKARFFYDFQPAAQQRDDSPIFVLSGGGPAASAMFLLAFHAPNTVALASDGSVAAFPNASSLSSLGHLLSIDARNAGFSYPLLADPSIRAMRESMFAAPDYNPYRDASDTWQVLFAFWELHPELAHHPVYLLAESYGALRVGIMLNMLFDAGEYASGLRAYSEPELFATLGELGRTLSVRGQILLEPWFAGTRQAEVAGALFEQPGSMLDELATAVGSVYQRCGTDAVDCIPYTNAVQLLAAIDRSLYDYRSGTDWIDRHVTLVSRAATSRAILAQLCGVEIPALDAVLGGDRSGAYRFADPARSLFTEQGDLEANYRSLEPWDKHFVPLNAEARDAFVAQTALNQEITPNRSDWGELFLGNLRRVPTFISRARYDLLIYAPALVPVIASYPTVREASLVAAAAPAAEEIRVEFMDGEIRMVFSPEYASSHSVSRDQPAQLVRDIAAFIARSP